ncbi:MAG: hypothetical protein ACK4ZU_00460 [Allorhizobium sp.]
MGQRSIHIANLARSELRGQNFVTFDVAMNGHVIATVDAPILAGRILWSHAAIHGFRDFDLGEKDLLEAEVDQALSPPSTAPLNAPDRRH